MHNSFSLSLYIQDQHFHQVANPNYNIRAAYLFIFFIWSITVLRQWSTQLPGDSLIIIEKQSHFLHSTQPQKEALLLLRFSFMGSNPCIMIKWKSLIDNFFFLGFCQECMDKYAWKFILPHLNAKWCQLSLLFTLRKFKLYLFDKI